MVRSPRNGPLFALALALPFTGMLDGLAAQDSLQLVDGRFLIGPRMSRTEEGVTVHFENGDVLVPKRLVKTSTALEASENQRAWTAEELAKIERGLVFFEGRWIKESRRKEFLDKRRAERAAQIEEAKKHRKWKDRHITKTQHFQFEYTIDPEVMTGFMDMMEVYYKTFIKTWKIKKPSGLGLLKVCFYHDQDYFQQVSGAGGGVIGYYRFVEPRELNFFYDRLDTEMTIDVMFHEANHYLTNLIDLRFRYPHWVNEALAEYYGASEWDPEQKKMIVGGLQEGRLAAIQDDIGSEKWMGLEDMIRDESAYEHYTWGWSFVHFLLSNNKYAPKFKRFYLGLARDRSIKRVPWSYNMREIEVDEQISALKKYLGVNSLKELEGEWHQYVQGLAQASHRGYLRAGSMALARGMPLKALRFLKKAIEMGSDNPFAHYQYARALIQKSKYAEAAEQLEQAIAKDPLNGMFYVRLAWCRSQRKSADPAELDRLRRLALEVDPDNYSVMLELAHDEVREAVGAGEEDK